MTIPESIQPAPIQPAPVQPMVATKRDSGLAIASLVCGIAAWIIVPFIGAIAAVILGHLAKKEIRESGGTVGGDGMALAGLLMGYIQIGLIILAVIIGVVLLLTFSTVSRNSSMLLPYLALL